LKGIAFTKMHGVGNDYIYINCFEEGQEEDWPELARQISDRHFGVGSDGLILILPSDKADFRMRMFNADGSEGEMCGNGMRAFAKYVYERGMTTKRSFTVETLAGIIRPEVQVTDGEVTSVRVDLGEPRLRREEIPMVGRPGERVIDEPLEVEGAVYRVTAVSMGNPHVVIFVDDVDAVDLEHLGPRFEHHPAFPQRVNVEFVQVLNRQEIKMRIWERGSGITLGSGTGSSASVVASVLNGKVDRAVTVHLPGGDLFIEWGQDNRIYMTGPAEEVCEGVFTKWRRRKH